MFISRCKLPHRYKVVSWYKWQENKELFIIQILSLFSIFLVSSDTLFWSITSISNINTILFTIGLIGLVRWSLLFNSKIEVYALKDNIHLIRNGHSFAQIPLYGNDVIQLKYKPCRFIELYKGIGKIEFMHEGHVITILHINSKRMVPYLANSLSQFINCHPDLVDKSKSFKISDKII